MSIRLLFVALVVGALGAYFLNSGAQRGVDRVRSSASRQLAAAQASVAPLLKSENQLAAAKALGGVAEISQAFDDANKPTAAALDVAVSSLAKLAQGEAAKPELLVVIAGGAAARFKTGAATRFDKDDAAFTALGPVGAARSTVVSLEGEPYQVAVAPLASADPSAPPVGQVALAYALDEALTKRLAAASGVDVSLIVGKKLVASSLSAPDRKALPLTVRPGAPLDFGELSGDRFSFFSLVKLPLGATGAAASSAVALPIGSDASAVLSVRVGEGYADLAESQKNFLLFMLLVVGLCVALSLPIGGNPTKGLSQLSGVADKIAQGDLSLRAPTESLAPGVRRLAVALNAIVASASQRAHAPAPAKAVLAEPPPVSSLLQGAAQPAAIPEPPPPPEEDSTAEELAQPASPGREDDFGGIFDAAPGLAKTSPPPPPDEPEPERRPDFNPDATVVAQVPEALVRATRNAAASSTPSPYRASPLPEYNAVPLPAPSGNSEDSHFQAVFREFVATREKCGEVADGLTFDKFVAKLRKNKDQLVAKYACKSVRFQVYVKDGKAALKATPVRD